RLRIVGIRVIVSFLLYVTNKFRFIYCHSPKDVSAGILFSFRDNFSMTFFTSSVGEIILLLPQKAESKAKGKLATIFFLFHSSSLLICFTIGLFNSENSN